MLVLKVKSAIEESHSLVLTFYVIPKKNFQYTSLLLFLASF